MQKERGAGAVSIEPKRQRSQDIQGANIIMMKIVELVKLWNTSNSSFCNNLSIRIMGSETGT